MIERRLAAVLIGSFERHKDLVVAQPIPTHRARRPKQLVVALAGKNRTLAFPLASLSFLKRLYEPRRRIWDLNLAERPFLLPAVTLAGGVEARRHHDVAAV